MFDFNTQLALLAYVLPDKVTGAGPYKGSLPLWLKHSARFIQVLTKNGGDVCLVFPKGDTSYENLIKIQTQAKKLMGCAALLVADDVNPKYRALFVKNKVPFVYKNQSLFAPELGIMLKASNLNKPTTRPKEDPHLVNPFELKLLAGYLTDHLQLTDFNLDDLQKCLKKNNYNCSKFKLSEAISNLVHFGLIAQTGRGPIRKLMFKDKKETWDNLNNIQIKSTHKIVAGYYRLNKIKPQLAHESALAELTNLNAPEKSFYAVTNKQYIEIEHAGEAVGNFGQPLFYYDIRKEDPKLFSTNKCLNPIEVYFELKDNPDPRIQKALEEMLAHYHLEAK